VNASSRHLKKRLAAARNRSRLASPKQHFGHWQLEPNRIFHKKSNFFSIVRQGLTDAAPSLLVQQEDGAEVVLITRVRSDGTRVFLLQLRAEPGLIGKVTYTSTIQSTWQNLRAEHGGQVPYFAEYAVDGTQNSKTLVDSTQFDWLGLYSSKKKRYRVLETLNELIAPESFVWVSENELKKLAANPHMLSVDLMVCISLLLSSRYELRLRKMKRKRAKRSLSEHARRMSREAKMRFFRKVWEGSSGGRAVVFVDYRSKDREVSSWIQPLLFVPGIRVIKADIFIDDEGLVLGICPRFPSNGESQILVHGAESEGEAASLQCECPEPIPAIELVASGEGGRFLWHEIRVQLTIHHHQTSVHSEDYFPTQQFMEALGSQLSSSVSFRVLGFLVWTLST
jgi:hypothetical protein